MYSDWRASVSGPHTDCTLTQAVIFDEEELIVDLIDNEVDNVSHVGTKQLHWRVLCERRLEDGTTGSINPIAIAGIDF